MQILQYVSYLQPTTQERLQGFKLLEIKVLAHRQFTPLLVEEESMSPYRSRTHRLLQLIWNAKAGSHCCLNNGKLKLYNCWRQTGKPAEGKSLMELAQRDSICVSFLEVLEQNKTNEVLNIKKFILSHFWGCNQDSLAGPRSP